MTLIYNSSLPCLHSLSVPNLDLDTNYLTELFPQHGFRSAAVMELVKSLMDKLTSSQLLFKSSKQVEWAIEILGYGLLPSSQFQHVRDERNYSESILSIYEYILCGQVELDLDGRSVEVQNNECILDIKEPSHQEVVMKMLCHLTLVFDQRNLDRKYPTPGGENKVIDEEMRPPIKFAATALNIYNKFLFKAYPFLVIKNWNLLIRLVIDLAMTFLDNKGKLPERLNIGLVELMYNAWILSGQQDEDLWNLLKTSIQSSLDKSIVASYWAEVCTELTIKLLVDRKCLEPPKLVIIGDRKQIEYQKNLLVIQHIHTMTTEDMEFNKSKSLFPQPFLFRISSKQTLYLWAKMATLMNDANFSLDKRTHYLVIKGITNMIALFLKIGTPYKPNPNVQEHTKWFTQQLARKIVIKHNFEYFKAALRNLLQYDKVRPKTSNLLRSALLMDQNQDSTSMHTSGTIASEPSPLQRRSSIDKAKIFSFKDELCWYIKTQKPPSGEILLKLFGKFLFDAADPSCGLPEDARLASITTLCQIFSKAEGLISEDSMKRFFKVCLQYIEKSTNLNFFQALMKHIWLLFTSNNISNSLILQNSLLERLLKYYYEARSETLIQDMSLRKSSNKLLSTLVCSVISDHKLIAETSNTYANMKERLNELLNLAFQRDREAVMSAKSQDKSTRNLMKTLAKSTWNLMLYSLLTSRISSFVTKINEIWLDRMLPVMNKLAFDVFQTLGEMSLRHIIGSQDQESLDGMAFAALMILEKTMLFLQNNKAIKQVSKKSVSEEKDTKDVDSQAILVIYTWTIILLKSKDNPVSKINQEFNSILKPCLTILCMYSKQGPLSDSVSILLKVLSNNIGNASLNADMPLLDSALLNSRAENVSEAYEKIEDQLEEHCIARFGYGEDSILSFYDLNIDYTDHGVFLITRNAAKKSFWNVELFYKLISSTKNPKSEDISIRKEVKTTEEGSSLASANLNVSETAIAESTSITEEAATSIKDFEDLLEEQFQMEEEYDQKRLECSKRGSGTDDQKKVEAEDEVEKAERDVIFNDQLTGIKLFLMNIGLLTSLNCDKITLIQKNRATASLLREIDCISPRTQIMAGLLYVQNADSELVVKSDHLRNSDAQFENFLDNIGLTIDGDAVNTGAFEGVRKLVERHKEIIYSPNILNEVILVSMNIEAKQKSIQECATISPIIVVWNSRTSEPYTKSLPLVINKLHIKERKTAIIITPLLNGSFLIDVLKQTQDYIAFPPVKGFVSSQEFLPKLVLQIIISSYRDIEINFNKRSCLDVVLSNYEERRKRIGELIAAHKSDSNTADVLKFLFDGKNLQAE